MGASFLPATLPVLGPRGARATDAVCQRLTEDRFSIDGQPFTLPLQIPDFSLFAQVFSVPTRAARQLLEGTRLSPAEIFPGQSVLTLLAVDYRDNPLGAYREAAVLLAAYAPGQPPAKLFGGLDMLRKRVGYYVHAMPVDQELTTHAGRFMWGFPKFLAQLEIEMNAQAARCRFTHEGELVFALQAPLSQRGHLEQAAYNFTQRDGVLRRVDAHVQAKGVSFRPLGASPEIGTRHPLSLTLRSLGLPKRPLCTLSLSRASARFGVPIAL